MQQLPKSVLLVWMAFAVTACYYDVEEELYPSNQCNTANVTYSLSVVAILSDRCYKCHDQRTNTGGITLEGHANLKRYVDSGRLLGAIKHQSGFSPMPQNEAQLPDCQIAQIEAWIQQGAPNN